MFCISDDYYHITTETTGVSICFVDIPAFMKLYMPEIDVGSFRNIKNTFFNPSGRLAVYFNQCDFDRINRFKVLKKQVEWMAGKVAVKKLASLSSGVKENALTIKAAESGAPYLEGYPGIPVTISHSGRYAVGVMGTDDIDVAVDIEKIEGGRMASIGRVAFSERELEELNNKSDADFYLWWTVKEAYLKIIRKGFAEGLKKVEFLKGHIVHHGEKVEGLTIESKIINGEYAFTLICR